MTRTEAVPRASDPRAADAVREGGTLPAGLAALVAARLSCDEREVRLEVVRAAARLRTRVAFVRATEPGGHAVDLVVKGVRGDPTALTAPNRFGRRGEARPRLASTTSLGERHRLEYETLVAAEAAFARLGDPGLGRVPVVGYLPEAHMLVMERVPGVGLRDLVEAVVRRGPLRGGEIERVADACATAGRWVRAFHDVDVTHPTPVRHGLRSEVVALAEGMCSFLGDNVGPRRWFGALGQALATAAETALPESLPLGLAHGDVAPRNVVVAPDGSVTVLDALGAVRAPILEDVAYFGVSLRTPALATATNGLLRDRAVVDRLERAFVEGYWGTEPPPWPAIRLYEVLVILDKWWGSPPRLGGGIAGLARRALEAPLADRFLRSEVRRLLDA